MRKLQKMKKKLLSLESQQSRFLDIIQECNQGVNETTESLVLQNRTIDKVDEVLERYHGLEQAEGETEKSFEARKKAILHTSPKFIRKIVFALAYERKNKYANKYNSLVKHTDRQKKLLSQWDLKLIQSQSSLAVIEKDIKMLKETINKKLADMARSKVKPELTPAMIMRRTLQKLENKEAKDAKRMKMILSSFGFRFIEDAKEAQKRTQKHIQKLKGSKSTKDLRKMWFLHRQVEAITESPKTPWFVGVEALREAKVINGYQSLLAKKRDIMRLYVEGGSVAELATKRFQELAVELEAFADELVFIKDIIDHYCDHLAKDKNDPVVKAMKEMHLHFSQVADSLKDALVSHIQEGIQGAFNSLGDIFNKNIFSLLSLRNNPELVKQKILPYIEDKAVIDATIQNFMERLDFCYNKNIDMFIDDQVVEGTKFDALANINILIEAEFDFNHNVEVIEKVTKRLLDMQTNEEIQSLLKLSNWKIAASSYQGLSTIHLKKSPSGRTLISTTESYAPLSLFMRYAPNLLIKVENDGVDSQEVGFLAETVSRNLGLAMLTSAGGGRTFLTKGALEAFKSLSNSLVDVKAYIASLAGSACREEWICDTAIGVKVFVLYGPDGKPVVDKDGFFTCYLNGNEGSAWYQYLKDNLCLQFRAVDAKWATEHLVKINQAQREQIIKDETWVKGIKSFYQQVSFFVERISQRNNYPLYQPFKNKDSKRTLSMSDKYAFIQGVKEVFYPGKRKKEFFHMEEAVGYNNVLFLPRLSSDLWHILPDEVRQVLPSLEEIVASENAADEAAEKCLVAVNEWVAKVYNHPEVEETDRVIFDQFKVGQDIHWLYRRLRDSKIGVIKSYETVYDAASVSKHWVQDISVSYAECIWENAMLLRELINHPERKANIKVAFPNGRRPIELAQKALDPSNNSEELDFIRSCMSVSAIKESGLELKPSTHAYTHNITKHSGSDNFKVSSRTAGTGASWIAENFAQILIEGKSFSQVKKENENNTEYPEFEGMETVYGATVDEAPNTSMLGKGMMAPINIATFRKLEGVTADNINGTKLPVLPKAVFNPYDGVAKNMFWKGYFKKLANKALKEKFRMLDIEDQADKALIEDYKAKGYTWRIHSYTIGDLHKSAVMIMRKLDKGRTQCTSQGTEKMLTGLHRENPSIDYINATKESTNEYLAYLGVLYVGGKYERKELPQVPGSEFENFKKYLSVNSISFTEETVSSDSIKASQKYITETSSKSKLSCIVSKDKFVLDGHHRWYSNDTINALVVDLSLEELIKVTSEFEGSWFNTEPTRYELLMQLTDLFKSLKSFDKDGNLCTDFMIDTNIDNEGFPLHMFVNMMGALCKMDGPTLIDSIEENVLNGADSELAAALMAMGADLHSSATLTNKKAESFDKKLSNYIRGAVIKGTNLVAQVYDDLPDDTIMLPAQFRGTTLGKLVLALIWRYPIASATSISEVKVVYSDDPKYASNLKRYGFNLKHFPLMILLPSAMKTSFQYDDDGDYFGVLAEPSFNPKKWELLYARAMNEVAAFNNGDYAATDNLKKLWKKYQGWIMVAAIQLKRSDYWAQNIEMLDIVTANNKKNMKIIDICGEVTEHFTKWGHRDGRGPVGLISDLFTVILASGLEGPAFTMLACACAYILQHSIDSAKKEKLVICAHILLNGYLWTRVNGKMELFPFVNTIVKQWNELWEDHEANEDEIRALEISAANELFKALGGSVSIEDCYWLPSIETIKAAAYQDNALVFYAPSTLLADMAKVKPPAGRYSTYSLFGQDVPVHPEYIDAIDPTRYMVKHCLELTDIISPLTGDVIQWKQAADFRKIRLRDYIDYKIVWVQDENGKLHPYVTWPELVDELGYANYWNSEDGFQCIETHSIPNTIFKNLLRWSSEQTYGGIEGLKNAREIFLKKTDSEGKVVQQHNLIPVAKAPARNIPWEIKIAEHLLNDQKQDEFARKHVTMEMVDGYPEITIPKKYELGEKLVWSFVSYSKVEIPKELLNHASDEFNFAPGSFKDQYEQLPVEKRQLFLRRIRAYLVRWFVAKISLPAYREATEAMYKRIAALDSLIANASGHDKALLEEEKRELTRNRVIDQGDVRYFVHSPDNFQSLFESKINSLYEEQITNYGRKAHRKFKLPFNQGFNWVKVPNWFSGTFDNWINICIGVVNDLVMKGFVRELGFSTCSYNQKFVEEIKTEDLYVDPDAKVKVIDDAKVIAFMRTHNQFHFESTGRTIYECESCMKSMRKHTTEVGRNAKFVRGTKEFIEHKVNESATKLAKACLESVEAQCKTVVRKGIEDEAYFDNNPYGISKESALEYIRIKGSDATKVRFGFATVYQEELFESWSKLWRGTNKEFFIEVVEDLNDCAWFTLTIEYLIYVGETIKLWYETGKQGALELKTQKQFENNDDTEPTPPSGGGGGGTPFKPVVSESKTPKVTSTPKIEQPKVEREKAPIKVEIIKNENIAFDQEQSNVIAGILSNFKTMNEQTLAGPAGCGKTTLAMEVAKRFSAKRNCKVFVTALTGAATLVLKTKLTAQCLPYGCSTTHSLLCSPDTSGYGLSFKPKVMREWESYKDVLVIIDEASMASVDLVATIKKTVRETRRTHGTQIKLLWMGDPYQLHPVNVKNDPKHNIGIDLYNPTFMLNKIYRNDGQILKLATAIRNNQPKPSIDKSVGDVVEMEVKINAEGIANGAIWTIDQLKEGYSKMGIPEAEIEKAIEVDGVRVKDNVLRYQTIVHSNNARNNINRAMRTKLGFSGNIQPEEILVMFADNGMYVNGEQLKVISTRRDENISDFLGKEFLRCKVRSLYFDPNSMNVNEILVPANLFESDKPLSFQNENKAIMWVLQTVDEKFERENLEFDYQQAEFEIKKALRLPVDMQRQWFETAPKLYVEIIRMGKNLFDNISEADYGYAITGHKSQGGEWRRIFVVKEWHMFQKDQGKVAKTEDTKRWYYTAVTRARERLVLVNYSKF